MGQHAVDMASISNTPNKDACRRYNHYRYGLEGLVPPDMKIDGKVSQMTLRRAILGHHVLYIAGSADVCNWNVQKDLSPQCGFCKFHRSMVADRQDHRFAFDMRSPVVSSCGAMWQGMTRFERMKIYKDLLEQVVAPRVDILKEVLHKHRHFRVMIGVGHDDHDVLEKLGRCFAHGFCSSGPLVPMEDFDPDASQPRSEVMFLKKFDERPSHESGEAAEMVTDDDGGRGMPAPLSRLPVMVTVFGSGVLLLTIAALACTVRQGRCKSAAPDETVLGLQPWHRGTRLPGRCRPPRGQLMVSGDPASSHLLTSLSPTFECRLPTA
jgi:hypothetical protein